MTAAREEIPGSPEDMARFRVWTATLAGSHIGWIAVINLHDSAVRRDIRWPASLAGKKYKAIFDIWNLGRVVPSETLHVNLPPHGCALFRIEDFEPRRPSP
jgi:alpha-galactosidase